MKTIDQATFEASNGKLATGTIFWYNFRRSFTLMRKIFDMNRNVNLILNVLLPLLRACFNSFDNTKVGEMYALGSSFSPHLRIAVLGRNRLVNIDDRSVLPMLAQVRLPMIYWYPFLLIAIEY